jgi:RNA polymerase sigma-70 factor (ECF subfamily)
MVGKDESTYAGDDGAGLPSDVTHSIALPRPPASASSGRGDKASASTYCGIDLSADPGDRIARYEGLFRNYYDIVLRICLRWLRDRSDAEDAVQETFVRALNTPAALAQPLAWLRRVATNLCIDELRRRRRIEQYLAQLHVEVDHHCDDKRLAQLDTRVADELLACLTYAEKRVVVSTLLEDRSHAVTAKLLGISPSTSRVLGSRARAKLRRRHVVAR